MGKRYGMVINLKRCIGCHTCTIACKVENGIEKGSWRKVYTIGGPSMDTPAGNYPDLKMHYLPKGCMHCQEAPCMESCPSEALCRSGDGIILVDEEKCSACMLCVEACPYGVITFNEGKQVIEKCDFCYERIGAGEEPFCVKCCQTKAMYFGDLNDPQSKVSRLIQEKGLTHSLRRKGQNPLCFVFLR